jgi:hypothetical protein
MRVRTLLSLARTLYIGLFAAAFVQLEAWSQTVWPVEDKTSWGLFIVDVETTGLDPAIHDMIDLGVIYADLDGRELERFFVRIMPAHPERLDPGAARVNGFTVQRWRELGAVEEAEAARRFLAFHSEVVRRHGGGDGQPRTWLFTAYNAWFDRSFLDALLQPNGSSIRQLFSYFQLDLPSLAWGAGAPQLLNREVAAALGLDDETRNPADHTGLTGAEWNLSIYRAAMARSPSSEVLNYRAP